GERCRSDRDPRSGCGTDGRARPRHCRFTATTLDAGRRRAGQIHAAHSCAPPARSDVRSAPERSALPETLRGKAAVNARSFFTELKPRNVYKLAISFASCGKATTL